MIDFCIIGSGIAGSTISKEAPQDKITIERSKQVSFEKSEE